MVWYLSSYWLEEWKDLPQQFSSLCVLTQAYADTVFPFTSVHHKPTISQTRLHSRITQEESYTLCPSMSQHLKVLPLTDFSWGLNCHCFKVSKWCTLLYSVCPSPYLNIQCVFPQRPSCSCSLSPLKFQCLFTAT